MRCGLARLEAAASEQCMHEQLNMDIGWPASVASTVPRAAERQRLLQRRLQWAGASSDASWCRGKPRDMSRATECSLLRRKVPPMAAALPAARGRYQPDARRARSPPEGTTHLLKPAEGLVLGGLLLRHHHRVLHAHQHAIPLFHQLWRGEVAAQPENERGVNIQERGAVHCGEQTREGQDGATTGELGLERRSAKMRRRRRHPLGQPEAAASDGQK